MKTFDDELEETLRNFKDEILGRRSGHGYESTKQALKEAIDKHIIGLDELEASPDGSKLYQGRASRNSLRRKQRERLALWGKEGEENDRRTS